MSRRDRTAWLLPVAAILLFAGCGMKEGQEISGSEKLTGPSGQKIAAMAEDMDDADNRREGIVLLANRDWGRQEPYLSWYANRLAVDKDAGVRSAAARALAKTGAVKYLPNLIAALADRSPQVRADVAAALEKLRGDAAIEPLRRTAAEDGSSDVRAAAAKTLRLYPQLKVVRTLVYCMSDDTFEVRHWAHESLVSMTGKDLGFEPGDWIPIVGADVPLHGPQWQRPWWDWMGTTKPDEPSPRAATQPAAQGKPWWDWMGVTRHGSPASQPATPASQPAAATRPAATSQAASSPGK